ncbi:MAG: isoprenylcysteine carboxylmethyltransferase family protein [Acidobacteria bacterium]|jgi:protein-S-isoprenylcysteine O-methyltransferase|nr:isoprenylcysteine carboxylmethyltransferase family protein [Acidobacteriota bacterium]
MIERILLIVVMLFPVSEIALSLIKRSRGRAAKSEDRGSMRLLWLSICLGVVLATAAEWVPGTQLPVPLPTIRVAALALLVGGLVVRWTAILTLGRLFTVDVAIHSDHDVVEHGLYRYMRHPSYTGLLIAFVGLGLFFADWLSIVVLLVPIILGVLNRVVKEERALLESLGPAYAAYCARTRRFVPGLL